MSRRAAVTVPEFRVMSLHTRGRRIVAARGGAALERALRDALRDARAATRRALTWWGENREVVVYAGGRVAVRLLVERGDVVELIKGRALARLTVGAYSVAVQSVRR